MKRVSIKLWLILASTVCSMQAMQQKMFDPNAFNEYANQYGNKTANLNELNTITQLLSSSAQSYTFQVPAFFGISTAAVWDYLDSVTIEEESVAVAIKTHWQEFKNAQQSNPDTLTDQAKESLQKIRTLVMKAFEQQQFSITDKTAEKERQNFLTTVNKSKKLLMVRSTGREDSKELANAGGNESIASVEPNDAAVSKAMGLVVASYFSEKSIGQRLVGKDQKLFDTPFMPVLLQIMIGEEEKNIPVSGVLFSQEAEGKTPGVTHINATFGHNEGVVNGLVAADTYYVGQFGTVHPLIRIKSNRLAPGKEGLQSMPNPRELQKKSSLNFLMIRALKQCADFVQNYYGAPQDIEFVILNQVIYLVQTRPITYPESNPQYLSDEYLQIVDAQNKQEVMVIGSAGSSVRLIDNPNHIIVKENLGAALKTFLELPDKNSIKLIISQELSPAMSHEATVFRSAGKPVIYCPDLSTIQPILAGPFAADLQRGLLVALNQKFDKKFILNGWLVHPIGPKCSWMPEFIESLTPKELAAIKPALLINKPIIQLLEIIRRGDAISAHNALKTVLYRLWANLQSEEKKQLQLKKSKQQLDPQLIKQLKNLFMHALTVSTEISKTIEQWDQSNKQEIDLLARMYPVTFLQALIAQIPVVEFVNDYSFGALFKQTKQEEKLAEEFGVKGDPLSVQYAKAADYALAESTSLEWKQFITGFAQIKDPELKQQFNRMLYSLADAKLLDVWINMSFATAFKDQKEPEKVAAALVQEYEKSKEFISQLQKIYNEFLAITIQHWELPDNFKKQLAALENVINQITNKNFISALDTQEKLAKIATVQILNSLVDQFDKSIKTLTGSTHYKEITEQELNIKINNFNLILKPYFNLLQALASLPSLKTDLSALLPIEGSITQMRNSIDDYIYEVGKLLKNAPKVTDESLKSLISRLKPSPRFNVAGATLASKANWERSIGQDQNPLFNPSLEDVFSLIHQNLLVITGVMAKKSGINTIALPNLPTHALDAIKKIKIGTESAKTVSPSLVGAELNESTITYFYNIPLRNHSNTFQLSYNSKTHKIILTTHLIGDARERWRNAFLFVDLVTSLSSLMLYKKPYLDEQKGILSWSWQVSNEEQSNKAIAYLNLVIDFFSEDFHPKQLLDGIIKISKEQKPDEIIGQLITIITTQKKFDKPIFYGNFLIKYNNDNTQLLFEQLLSQAKNNLSVSMFIIKNLIDGVNFSRQSTLQKQLEDFLIELLQKTTDQETHRFIYKAIAHLGTNLFESSIRLANKAIEEGFTQEATNIFIAAVKKHMDKTMKDVPSAQDLLLAKNFFITNLSILLTEDDSTIENLIESIGHTNNWLHIPELLNAFVINKNNIKQLDPMKQSYLYTMILLLLKKIVKNETFRKNLKEEDKTTMFELLNNIVSSDFNIYLPNYSSFTIEFLNHLIRQPLITPKAFEFVIYTLKNRLTSKNVSIEELFKIYLQNYTDPNYKLSKYARKNEESTANDLRVFIDELKKLNPPLQSDLNALETLNAINNDYIQDQKTMDVIINTLLTTTIPGIINTNNSLETFNPFWQHIKDLITLLRGYQQYHELLKSLLEKSIIPFFQNHTTPIPNSVKDALDYIEKSKQETETKKE